jgi:hypothetical protein
MRFKIRVHKSPMLEKWYARVDVDGDAKVDYDPGQQLAGTGDNAITAVQGALQALARANPYQELILEAALMAGTRTAGRLEGKRRS